ncbi:cobaltochelatase subunit CobN [Methanobacterium alcaliphilum]|uniref:cobaltochelatase subunit CobN n=1 Tax=Methanobacterium alcaliphilum TaxID=392018 RepID=UPI00200B0142|nr:cobaltochelatase subunit CobN [Methanobacterium alcaliphilum]MCK9150783.1 cobaltochelatase subunit CobN [Methanobacterium alcaliphilum]
MIILILIFLGSGTVFAGNSGDPLNTTQNGTVSGGVYTDSYYGFNESSQSSGSSNIVTKDFMDLPQNATVKWAQLSVVIYSGSQTANYSGYANVSFNDHQIGYEHLSSSYTMNTTALWLNDHVNRVSSDYLMFYDVTDLVKTQNTATVITTPTGSFDGRIKLINLVVAYDDGDTDEIFYWINFGHEALNTTIGTTYFNGTIAGEIKDANLTVVHLASNDGKYLFNGNNIPAGSPQGTYSGSNTWNVTDYCINTPVNILNYNNLDGFFYKIMMSILTVKYEAPATNDPDLKIPSIETSQLLLNQPSQVLVNIFNSGNSSASSFYVKLFDGATEIGSKLISNLDAWSSTSVSFNWTPDSAGYHNLKAIVDTENTVDESNETNNQLTLQVLVEKLRPDLTVLNLTLPSSSSVNTTYNITTVIANTGLNQSASFLVKLFDNGQEVGSQSINNLNVNENRTLTFSWKPNTIGSHILKIVIDPLNVINETNKTNNELSQSILVKEAGKIVVFLISDTTGTNILNTAALEILSEYPERFIIQIRSNSQVGNMTDSELVSYLSSCDVFIGEWLSTSVGTKLLSILKSQPALANKSVFLILEPPVSSLSESVELMKYSTINGVKLLSSYNTTQLTNYYNKTSRGTEYSDVLSYINSCGFPSLYNQATLYKDLNDKDNLKNQILWALNLAGAEVTYLNPTYSIGKQDYGIYRHKWYVKWDSTTNQYVMDLESYMADYFVSGRPCVGLIESTMYLESEMLQPYYEIIEALEAKGLNVIPVLAAGGSSTQLKVMLQAFTNATDVVAFVNNTSNYLIRVDAVIEMPAYGLGGDNFTSTTDFFNALNVPIIRAIHSDSITNEQWELSSTGLPTAGGDKWWHISISEAQGIILATFIGGKNTVINNQTGAEILGYVPQSVNIESMADKIRAWVQLKYTSNADKLLAIIYYNYPPGKDNIGSSYMNTVESVYNLLNILKSEGYNVTDIPKNESALRELMLAVGINVANWAPGVLVNLTENPNVILYPVSSYQAWFSKLDNLTQLQVIEGPVAYIGELCKKAVDLNYTEDMAEKIDAWYSEIIALLPENRTAAATPVLNNIKTALKNYVSTKNATYYQQFLTYKAQFFALNVSGMNGWGNIPGNVMVVKKNGVDYFVIPGLKFGNIFIGPEPQRGWEADADKLYHSSAVAPPHQYLAYFAYLQEQGTSAMIFMGRHATHEWLPGKETILATYDLPSVVTGSIPQIYFYISDGLAEGIQAKRRGFAVMISHLTPPMTFTALYGDLGKLSTLVSDYDGANATVRQDILTQIAQIIKKNSYNMGNTTVLTGDALIAAVESYLYDIQSTLYPYGLHAIGSPWTDEEIALLVTSMLSVDTEYLTGGGTTSLFNEVAKILKGKNYTDLTAAEKQTVQQKSISIVTSLIKWDVTTVATLLTTSPSANLKAILLKGKEYIKAVNDSVSNEINSLLDALNGGYVSPGSGGDPISNPDVLPTGTNFFDDQSSEIPTKEAYEYAKTLALLAMANMNDDMEKIALGIWCVETARDDGALVAMVLYFLGMEPQWSSSPSAGVNGHILNTMPKYVELSNLIRPSGWEKKRIDVVIITSGLFRDLYSRQAILLDNAFRVALARSYYTIINNNTLKNLNVKTALDKIMDGIGYYGLGSEELSQNYVAKHWVEDFIYYLSLNMTPEYAGEMAISRIFAPPEGDYGAGIAKAASLSWTWEERMEVAEYYLKRMGHIYTKNNWGVTNPAVFARALSGIDTMFASRNTNLYGVLDNDDFFDYWGGLSMALEKVNGKVPNFYVLDYANKNNAKTLTIEQYINRELVTREFNPSYIKAMMNEGYDGARYFSKFMKNLKGWATTRPSAVLNDYWNNVVDIYIKDKYNIGVNQFLNSADNTYALISMTGTLLEMAYKGIWKTDVNTLKLVANQWAQAAINNGVACCDCSCGNLAMMEWASQFINPNILAQFKSTIYAATQSASFAPSPTPNPSQGGSPSSGSSTPQSSESGSSSSDSSSSASESGSAGSDSNQEKVDESQTTPGESGEKAYEVSESSSGASTKSDMPIYAILGLVCLIGLFGAGYYFGPRKNN